MLISMDQGIPVIPVGYLSLESGPRDATIARHWNSGILPAENWPECVITSAATIITELVSNAVHHAEARRILCKVYYRIRRPLIKVYDGDPREPRIRAHPPLGLVDIDALSLPELESGRGLLLVEELSQWWGYRQVPYGKFVWSIPKLPRPTP